MEKSKIIKYSCFGAGIFFILAGLLLILIPSFTLPNYSMYKNGAVVSNDYSLATSEEEYLKTIYSSLNADEESYFLLTNELDDIEKEKISSKINISSIYDTNFNENGKNISVNISLTFEYSEEFIENLNSGTEKISAYPSIYLLLETNEKEIKSSSLNLLPLADSLRFEEFKVDTFNKNSLTDGYINVISEGKLETLTNAGETKTYDFSISRIDLEFFAE